MHNGLPNKIYIYTDGGSRGNPGPAALGVYITDDMGIKIDGFGKALGIATNNVAEYQAVVMALDWLLDHKKEIDSKTTIRFHLDSQLVCYQINGLYKIKNAVLRDFLFAIREKESDLALTIHYVYIPREKNKMADSFVNEALDKEEAAKTPDFIKFS